MQPQQIRDILKQTLDDRHFSRSERSALEQIFEHVEMSDQVVAQCRAVAFELARKETVDPAANRAIRWLEGVVKMLAAQRESGSDSTLAESYFGPGESCPQRVAGFIRGAKRTVDICVFTITDDRISSAIVDAYTAGRQMRVITDDQKSYDAGSDIEAMVNEGIDVRVDCSPAHMHHKFALTDNTTLLTGSYNWTRSAASANAENFIVTSDRRFVEAFAGQFEKLWRESQVPRF